MSGKTSMLEALHNRVLLKNTHKYVLKKVLTSQKEEWCQRYLTVASPKLSQPLKHVKLPYSLRKKCKTENEENKQYINTYYHNKVAIITNIETSNANEENTIDDEELLRKGKECQKVLLRRKKLQKKSPFLIKRKMRNFQNVLGNKQNLSPLKRKQNFKLEPWSVQKDGEETKENYFY